MASSRKSKDRFNFFPQDSRIRKLLSLNRSKAKDNHQKRSENSNHSRHMTRVRAGKLKCTTCKEDIVFTKPNDSYHTASCNFCGISGSGATTAQALNEYYNNKGENVAKGNKWISL